MSKWKNGRALFMQWTYKDKKLALSSLFNSDQGRDGGDIFDFTKNTVKWGRDIPKKQATDELSNSFANTPELLRQKVCLVLRRTN